MIRHILLATTCLTLIPAEIQAESALGPEWDAQVRAAVQPEFDTVAAEIQTLKDRVAELEASGGADVHALEERIRALEEALDVEPPPPPPPGEENVVVLLESAGNSYTDPDGNVWRADQFFQGGNTVDRGAVELEGTDKDRLYQTERYGLTGYEIPLGEAAYTVRLHFAETYSGITAAGQRVFSVAVEGQRLDNLDIFAEAGRNTALVKEFEVSVTDGTLNISFEAGIQSPIVNAIEVTSEEDVEPPPPLPPPPPPQNGGVQIIPTFESAGIYWTPPSTGGPGIVTMRYAEQGGEWKETLPPWLDVQDNEYRGSIFFLKPGTQYDVEIVDESGIAHFGRFQTWPETDQWQIAQREVMPPHSGAPIEINNSAPLVAGTRPFAEFCPNGYTLYEPANGDSWVVDVANLHPYAVEIEGGCVILRAPILREGQRGLIRLGPNAHDVLIEECDLHTWGRPGDLPFGRTDGAIEAVDPNSNPNLKRIVVQRCRIHHPRYDTNAWNQFNSQSNTNHPTGPQAIQLHNSGGNHVFRYLRVDSDEDHQFNDALGGFRNFSNEGFPGPDTDIYGLYLSHCWDECIEAEGGGMNVRIWGVFIDMSFPKIGVAPIGKGPLYVLYSVFGRGQFGEGRGFGFGPLIKGGDAVRSGTRYGGGAFYFIHNTQLQPGGSVHGLRMSHNAGEAFWITSLNNVVPVGQDYYKDGNGSCLNRSDYNLYTGRIVNDCASRPHERNGINASPQHQTGEGVFSLVPGSPGHDAGIRLPGINDGFLGAAPDMGAHETGAAPMEFGVDAYRGRRWGQ